MIGSGLFTKYEEIVNAAFQTDMGKDITMYFEGDLIALPTGVVSTYGGGTYDIYGDDVPVDDTAGRFQQSATGVKTEVTTQTIKGRVYWEKNPSFIPEIKVDKDATVCRLNISTEYAVKLKQCKYIEVESQSSPYIKLLATMVRAPLPYGFGGNYQRCISYWQVI